MRSGPARISIVAPAASSASSCSSCWAPNSKIMTWEISGPPVLGHSSSAGRFRPISGRAAPVSARRGTRRPRPQAVTRRRAPARAYVDAIPLTMRYGTSACWARTETRSSRSGREKRTIVAIRMNPDGVSSATVPRLRGRARRERAQTSSPPSSGAVACLARARALASAFALALARAFARAFALALASARALAFALAAAAAAAFCFAASSACAAPAGAAAVAWRWRRRGRWQARRRRRRRRGRAAAGGGLRGRLGLRRRWGRGNRSGIGCRRGQRGCGDGRSHGKHPKSRDPGFLRAGARHRPAPAKL